MDTKKPEKPAYLYATTKNFSGANIGEVFGIAKKKLKKINFQ